ncbi:SMI1/KNR4 family protein [Pontibacter amylolyticus]|uniref:Knr4/Smi1-like domain-containing protein n=1 Tax=Pontibacter amylolyticus TaxID=1424080 RepID=A0ABQ1WIN7_9BACT|nr:SMI1/KNR4 family protein [Pontibacter amylolyticus]GGG30679.1 hypothetical protein GCM10011323_37680 [Pontibacter amylolyticus]
MIKEENLRQLLKEQKSLRVRLHEQDWEFEIWPLDKLNEWNNGYNVQESLPGYLAFGSDGGLEMLTVEQSTGKVYSVPFIPMDITEGIKVSDSLEELIEKQK